MGRKGMKAFVKKAMTGGGETEDEVPAQPTPTAAPGPSTSKSVEPKQEKEASKFLKVTETAPPLAQPKAPIVKPSATTSDGEDEEDAGPAGEKGESKGQMIQRHKRELKAHQKAMSKLGKNKKDEKEKLDKEIEERHVQELKQLEDKENAAPNTQADMANGAAGTKVKQTKAQKRKEKMATKRAERDARIAQEHEEDGPSAREIEEDQLLAVLQPLALTIHDIRADGHCLYRALEHQLLQVAPQEPRRDYQQLRSLAAAHIREHPEDYQPFIMEEDAEGDGAEQLEAYCKALESTAAWGGQLELRALAASLQRCIRVYAVGMPPLVMGEEHQGRAPVQLCFLRHAFGLGEHYNSVLPADDEEESDEDEHESEEGAVDGEGAKSS